MSVIEKEIINTSCVVIVKYKGVKKYIHRDFFNFRGQKVELGYTEHIKHAKQFTNEEIAIIFIDQNLRENKDININTNTVEIFKIENTVKLCEKSNTQY